MHNKSNVSDGHSESEVILITIYQLTKKKKKQFYQLKTSKNIKYGHHSIQKRRRKKMSNEFFKRGVYHVWHAIFFFFFEHVWHAIYALLLIPYNDVVEDKALLHNAMNFLSTAIG